MDFSEVREPQIQGGVRYLVQKTKDVLNPSLFSIVNDPILAAATLPLRVAPYTEDHATDKSLYDRFLHICFVSPYSNYSTDELRLMGSLGSLEDR